MTPVFTHFVLSHASANTASQNIGGSDTWAVPPPQIVGGPSPAVPYMSPPTVVHMKYKFHRWHPQSWATCLSLLNV